MTPDAILDLLKAAGAACAESLTRFYQAYPNAPSIREVRFDVDFDAYELTVPEKNLQEMIEEHFEADAGLARQLGRIAADIRQDLPELARSFSVQVLVEAYISPERGLHYILDDTVTSINGVTTWRPDIGLERLASVSGPYQRSGSDPAVWMVLRRNKGNLKSTDERVIAGSLEEAVVTYACLGMGKAEYLAILNGDEEAIERHLSDLAVIAEPDENASDVLRGGRWTKTISEAVPGL